MDLTSCSLHLHVALTTSLDICNSLSRTSTHHDGVAPLGPAQAEAERRAARVGAEVAPGARSAIFFMGFIEMDDRVLPPPPKCRHLTMGR